MNVPPSLRDVVARVRWSATTRGRRRRSDAERPSAQRLGLMGVALLAVVVALVVIGAVTDLVVGGFSVGVLVLAVVGVRQPDTLVPTAVVGFVIARWVVSDGSPTSPAVLAIAAALALFHTTVALLASVPVRATVPREVLRRWAVRWVVVVGLTAAWWGALLVLDRRDAGGSSIVTVAALAAVVLGVALVRRRVLDVAATRSDAGRIAG